MVVAETRAQIYLDGVLVAGVENQQPHALTNAGSFSLGNYNLPVGSTNQQFNGTLDEVMIWNRALLPDELVCLYDSLAAEDAVRSDGLLLWNKLDSTNSVLHSEVGADGSFTGGTFVPGVFGQAVELDGSQKFGVAFPVDALTTTVGCLEFWAKMSDFPEYMPGGACPGLIGWGAPGQTDGYVFFFAPNDGDANGGLCLRGVMAWIGTGPIGSWTYSAAIGGGAVSDWHHYAVVWHTNGVAGVGDGTRKVVVYVDGRVNSAHGTFGTYPGFLGGMPAGSRFGLLNGEVSGRVAYDNLKIWNYAKTNFSDRFAEDATNLHHPPCLSLTANRAFYALATLAYNILTALKVLDLDDGQQAWRARSIIRHLLTIPATLVCHANRRRLKLCIPAGLLNWWRLFLARFVPRRKRGEGTDEAYWPVLNE